jgi:flagellar hook protein FlgE
MSLTGTIYIGLSGMNAYSDGLQIISNNVANLDTIGYKAETVGFSDIYNSSGQSGLSYLGSGNGERGEGVQVEPAGTDFTQGTLEQTGNALDLAVQGDGFLVLQSSGQTYYARTGSFSVGQDGDITLAGTPAGSSYNLMVLNSANQPTPVNVNADNTSAPVATTNITLGDNLSSTATTATVSNVIVYDSLGNSQTWTITATPNTSNSSSSSSSSSSSDQTWSIAVTNANGDSVGSGTIGFSGGAIDPASSSVTINNTLSDGAAALAVKLDFSGVTSFDAGSTSTLATTKVDGNSAGTLSSVTVDSSGNLVVSYSNSTTKSLGPVAIANIQNPQLLNKMGGGLYSNHEGALSQLVASGSSSAGTVVSGQLETSNVNLTQEFGDLILIQRGYQASSEVVSVSNDMIQQLFGIRGQGG